ncbi:MAG: hypothetical protein J6A75_13670 [Lachnospiraceae bacterium]|nr:hypothetical protein [Lachnospiraceae bacterium]
MNRSVIILKYRYKDDTETLEQSILEAVHVKVFGTRGEANDFVLNTLAKKWVEENKTVVEENGGLPEAFYENIEEMEDFLIRLEERGYYSFTFEIEEAEVDFSEAYFAEKCWRKDDIASEIIGARYEATEENINEVLDTMQAKGYMSVLLDCTDAEWDIIDRAVEETLGGK